LIARIYILGEAECVRNGESMFKNIVGNIASTIIINIFVAICTALGFGPAEWTTFLMSGMPIFLTPGVVRLGFLLIASAVLFLEWRSSVQNAISAWSMRSRLIGLTAFVIACCLPFVIGAFYITANSAPIAAGRHLSHHQKDILHKAIAQIPPNVLERFLVASVDDPEATNYGIQFIYFFKYYGVDIYDNYADPPANTLDVPYPIKEVNMIAGLSISVFDTHNPPESAKALDSAMKRAGFQIDYEKFYGTMPFNAPFILTIRYK
jgi:hypothetical protein